MIFLLTISNNIEITVTTFRLCSDKCVSPILSLIKRFVIYITINRDILITFCYIIHDHQQIFRQKKIIVKYFLDNFDLLGSNNILTLDNTKYVSDKIN